MRSLIASVVGGLWIGAFFALFFYITPPSHGLGFLIGLTIVFLPALAVLMAFGVQVWKET